MGYSAVWWRGEGRSVGTGATYGKVGFCELSTPHPHPKSHVEGPECKSNRKSLDANARLYKD